MEDLHSSPSSNREREAEANSLQLWKVGKVLLSSHLEEENHTTFKKRFFSLSKHEEIIVCKMQLKHMKSKY